MDNPIIERMQWFSRTYGKAVSVEGNSWRYYRLGEGPAILWLTGGLRRAAFGFRLLERLALSHSVVSPDYPPLMRADDMLDGIAAILKTEGMERTVVLGQSYGGLLAQGLVSRFPGLVDRLILSSSGPADYGLAWLPIEYLLIAAIRVFPEEKTKSLLAGGLLKVVSVPDAERNNWAEALRSVMENELCRQDIVSHFAVAADLIRRRIVRRDVLRSWPGRVAILAADNDPTQGPKDKARLERLFGKPVERLSLGDMGHTAALLDPERYAEILESSLADGVPARG